MRLMYNSQWLNDLALVRQKKLTCCVEFVDIVLKLSLYISFLVRIVRSFPAYFSVLYCYKGNL